MHVILFTAPIQPTFSPLKTAAQPLDNSTLERLVRGFADKHIGVYT